MNGTHKTVILADGNFPTAPIPFQLLKEAEHLVCCDGAAAHFTEGRKPDAVVGDMDTLSTSLQEYFADVIYHEAEQETNDLCKAFRFCLQMGWRDIVILGATGGREDHSLGNLGHLIEFARKIPHIRMVTDAGEFSVAWQSGIFSAKPGQQISIIAPFANTTVSSTGLKYKMDQLCLHYWWQATLNEAQGNSFSLDFTPGHPLLIFKPE